uniref:Putative LOV domain-containing protein n=1 Tax=Gnetum montanum TaxID=3381 RepID=A0A126WXC8_9SPER|nr:putative LOV domain-containing protein [Gnetum montanum]
MGMENPTKNRSSNDVGRQQMMIEQSLNNPYSEEVREALAEMHCYNFIITDPCLPDHPIVYASDGFLKMTDYSSEEVVGRNARFLQGPRTERRTVLEIREAIRQESSCQVCILNHRKNGEAFWCYLHIAPVFSKRDGRLIHFIGVQIPISKIHQDSMSRSLIAPSMVTCPTCRDGDIVSSCHTSNGVINSVINFGSCRRQLLANVSVELARTGLYSPVTDNGSDTEHETCKPKDTHKRRATDAVNSILSELAKFSQLKETFVSEKNCINTTVRIVPIPSSLVLALSNIQQSFVLTDPLLPDMPIVYASNMFLQLTGYSKEEIIGHNCRFLQGFERDRSSTLQVKKSIEAEKCCTLRILNYRKDGSPFWNLLHIAPIRDSSGKIAFHAGVQMELPDTTDEECSENLTTSPHIKQLSAIGAIRIAVRSFAR